MRRTNLGFLCVAAIVIALGVTLSLRANVPPPENQAARGVDLLEAETLLSNLGYWILKVDGISDSSTRHAITAFQKVEGRKRSGTLNTTDVEALRLARTPKAKFQTMPAHVEIDLTRQILFLTDQSGAVIRILPVSSGNETKYFDKGKWQVAHTPRGHFRIERQIGGVRKASLGNLYFPNYFFGGFAIHGSNSVPSYPASHGCVRIPRFADRAFSRMVNIGTDVFIYD